MRAPVCQRRCEAMTVRFKAHFDGTALIPDEPIELPTDRTLEAQVDIVPREHGDTTGVKIGWRAKALEEFIARARNHPPVSLEAFGRDSLYEDPL